MLARRWFPALILAVCAACAGCAEREQKFDIVPGPITIGLIWRHAGDDPCAPGAAQWACIDELLVSYRRDYEDLLRREAEPLLATLRDQPANRWRRDLQLMERLVARQGVLLHELRRLDDGFFGALPGCGAEAALVARLRIERTIEVRRQVIEGRGPALVDLREMVSASDRRQPAVVAVLDEYASQLAELLGGLVESERGRLVRHRRALERLEAEAGAAGTPPGEQAERDREAKAEEEAAVPVRRSMARLLDLNLATLERLRPLLSDEAAEALATAARHALDEGRGGTGGDPATIWQVEVVTETAAIGEDRRRALLDRLASFRQRDALLSERLVQAMRSGSAIPVGDPRRAERDALRKELIGEALACLPEGMREPLASIRNLDDAAKTTLLRTMAPAAADRLMARMPASLRSGPPEEDPFPSRPDEMNQVFLPPPADERWLASVMDRLELSAETRAVASQLWRDDAANALRALEPLHGATKAAESQIGPSLSDPASARRAIDAYFSAIDREREVIAVAEDRFLDSLASMLPDDWHGRVERLRRERRIARERIDWRFMPFGDRMGFGPEAAFGAVDAVARADLDDEERELAESVLDARLAELADAAVAFRAAGVGAIRRLVVAFARGPEGGDAEERLRAAMPSIAGATREPVAMHRSLQRSALEEIASALGERGWRIRASWRRLVAPELFLDDATIEQACAAATSRSRGDEALETRLRDRIRLFEVELDEVEESVMAARRSTVIDDPPRRRPDIQERLRWWPLLSSTLIARRETQARLLRDLACMTGDPALRQAMQAWSEPSRGSGRWVYD